VSLRSELFEQPQAAQRLLETGREPLLRVAARLADRPVDFAVVAARGSSDHAAIYAQYLFGVRHRLPVALAAPSVLSLYGVAPRFERALVIGISQSGASPDIVSVVASARRQGAPTIAITNDPASPLGREAECVLDLVAGPELAVAATKTYTTSLLAIARLSLALDPEAAGSAALAAVPDAVDEALKVESAVESVARELAAEEGGLGRCVIVGRGYEYATAREWALKLKELGRVFADPYSSADFLHGPIALVQPGIPVLVLAPTGVPAEGQRELLRDLADRGVETVVVSDDPDALALGRWSIPIPASVPEWLRPIVSIVPAQLFAYHATLARGLDPDAPRYIAKVTRTT
jgi:glutamine---fructose-6-phosphate transaminase (isomerizing)